MLLDTTFYMYVMKCGYGTRACMYDNKCFYQPGDCINTFFKLCVQVILGLSGGECVCTSMQAMPVGSMYPISIELPHITCLFDFT